MFKQKEKKIIPGKLLNFEVLSYNNFSIINRIECIYKYTYLYCILILHKYFLNHKISPVFYFLEILINFGMQT